MKVRRSVVLFLTLLLGFFPPRRTFGDGLPPEVRTTTNANAVRTQIQNLVNDKISILASGDATAMPAARAALLAEMDASKGTSGVVPSAEFLRAYAEVIAADLEPLTKSDNPRLRLNAAVIVAKVAEKSPSLKLVPAAQAMLTDDSQAVVLWGIKASKFLIPAVLSNPATSKNSPLIRDFLAAAKHYGDSGWMVQAAYEALRIDSAIINMTPAAQAAAVPAIVDVMHELLSQRLEQYKQVVPDLPNAEASASTFLTIEEIWKRERPEQQLRTVQLISDLIALAGQQATAPDIQTIARTELIDLLKAAAGALTVVGKWTHTEAAMFEAVGPFKLTSSSIASADLKKRVDQVYPGLIKIPQFSKLKPLPKPQ